MSVNIEKLQTAVEHARTVSNLFRKEMDVIAFQKGLEEAETAIHSLKVATGMATNYPTSTEPYGGIQSISQENLRNRITSGKITLGEDEEDENMDDTSTGGTVTTLPTSITVPTGKPFVNARRKMKMYRNPLIKYTGIGGRRSTQQRAKRRSSTHKRKRI